MFCLHIYICCEVTAPPAAEHSRRHHHRNTLTLPDSKPGRHSLTHTHREDPYNTACEIPAPISKLTSRQICGDGTNLACELKWPEFLDKFDFVQSSRDSNSLKSKHCHLWWTRQLIQKRLNMTFLKIAPDPVDRKIEL